MPLVTVRDAAWTSRLHVTRTPLGTFATDMEVLVWIQDPPIPRCRSYVCAIVVDSFPIVHLA